MPAQRRRHPPRLYKQHTEETCGISCALMVLHHFHRVQYPTPRQERKLYNFYHCRSFKGTLPTAMALLLLRNRLAVSVYHSSPEYLDNRDGYYPPELYRALMAEYQEDLAAIGSGAAVHTGFAQTPAWYREQLAAGRLLIVQVFVTGDADGMHDKVLHWVLLYGCDGDAFLIADPNSVKLRLTEQEMLRYTDTPIGHVCLTVEEGIR